jgi:DNA-binding beta-propeller fold protein YncE
MIHINKFSHLSLIVWFSAMISVVAAPDAKQPEPAEPSKWGLAVSEYAPGGSDQISFKWPTHIAFGPEGQEIVTDLKNNRFLYRDGPGNLLKVSPIAVRGQHSVVYNPADSLYYANDTDNNRLISFADLSKATITAQTNKILGVPLKRPHDIVIDPATGWIYALNPNSGHVFRFSAIGKNESVLSLGKHLGGYSRSLTFANGHLYVIGSAEGRIVEVLDWDKAQVKVYNSFKKKRNAPAGSWTKTGLVLNDAEFFNGFWYASSYFTESYAGGTNPNENKFIRFKTLADLVSGNWEDLSSLVPDGMTPYYFTVQNGSLYLAIFDHSKLGAGDDVILQFTPLKK